MSFLKSTIIILSMLVASTSFAQVGEIKKEVKKDKEQQEEKKEGILKRIMSIRGAALGGNHA